MEEHGHKPETALETVAPERERRRSSLPLLVVAALLVIVPFLTWYGTWFGRHLSDQEISEYLSDQQNTRHVQHALAQIAERMDNHDDGVRRFYPQLIALADSPVTELRLTVAWLMGKDNRSEEFHRTLLRLVLDREPMVRRNAALSLVTFNDDSGRAELRAMLSPFGVVAPVRGTFSRALPDHSVVQMGTLVGHIKREDGQLQEVRSPVPGTLVHYEKNEGDYFADDEVVAVLGTDSDNVWEALRALYIVGKRDDLPYVQSFMNDSGPASDRIAKQAALTAEAIESRSKNSQ